MLSLAGRGTLQPGRASPLVMSRRRVANRTRFSVSAQLVEDSQQDGRVLVQDATQILVKLQRPLGIVLASRPGGAGIYVESLVPKGNADISGLVKKNDYLLSVGGTNGTTVDVQNFSFDEAMDVIGATEGKTLELVFERQVMSTADGQESMISSYWDQKRKEKELGAKRPMRRSGGLVPKEIALGKSAVMGQGSFGTVFFGSWKGQEVVLKRPNERVVGAEELMEAEMIVNELVARDAPGACATYIGTCEVGPQEDGPLYEGRLNQGLWLVWKYEGRNTFNDLLDKKEADLASVAAALRMPAGSPAPAVAAKALTQVLTSLAALHKMGIVHRDVKPQNLIACESDGALRLIDLGAAASCLNPKHVVSYARGEGPCDPLFCSERFLIPEDAALPEGRNLAALWAQHTPDRFDLFSVGVVLMQLALPSLRGEVALKSFGSQLEGCGSDLGAWREKHGASWKVEGSEVLSANGGAGWELATSLLASRAMRPTAVDALKHRFFSGAAGAGSGGGKGAAAAQEAPKKKGWLPF